MIFDADWGELDFMLVDLPRNWRYSSFNCAGFANNGVVVVSTPQAVALADERKVSMFLSEAINVPVLGNN
jgi:ATP-binding protein involved in chromosome partitioning